MPAIAAVTPRLCAWRSPASSNRGGDVGKSIVSRHSAIALELVRSLAGAWADDFPDLEGIRHGMEADVRREFPFYAATQLSHREAGRSGDEGEEATRVARGASLRLGLAPG
jgi:hypothetical protein